MEMTKEQKIKRSLIIIGVINLGFILIFWSSPIIWIWYGWSLAWKIALSSYICHKIVNVFYTAFEEVANENKGEVVNTGDKSKFSVRLDEALKNQRSK